MKKIYLRQRINYITIKKIFLIKHLQFFIIIFVILLLLFLYINKRVVVYMEEAAKYETNQIINDIINYSVEQTQYGYMGLDFVNIQRDEDGKIKSLTTDTTLTNMYATDVCKEIQKRLDELQDEKIKIPSGAMFGNGITSSLGKNICFKIIPKGNVIVKPNTTFEGAGINQTVHKLYLNIEIDVGVLFPLLKSNTNVSRIVLISETVIVGNVPNYMWR